MKLPTRYHAPMIAHSARQFGMYASWATAWARKAQTVACPAEKENCRQLARMWGKEARDALARVRRYDAMHREAA